MNNLNLILVVTKYVIYSCVTEGGSYRTKQQNCTDNVKDDKRVDYQHNRNYNTHKPKYNNSESCAS